jgi:Type I phosphodiesterase / nucleotide pyrophosphatase
MMNSPAFIRRAFLTVLAVSLCAAARPQAVPPVASPKPTSAERLRVERAAFLEMFARAYYPGRSGQIMVVPREGDILTRPGVDVPFMHGSPWSYDTRIPLLFWGPRYVRSGRPQEAVSQEDVAPTLARALGLSMRDVTGHVLTSALKTGAPAPKVAVLLVLDAFRGDYLDRYVAQIPTLSRLRREGAFFEKARVTHLPTITSVGHATIATGTEPRFHGIVANTAYNRVKGEVQDAYPSLSPENLAAPALADLLNFETDGKAVILVQTSTSGASGLAGHGACIFNGRPIAYASYSFTSGKWETNPRCFRLPDYLRDRNVRSLWEGGERRWMEHDITAPDIVRRSAPFARFETDALVSMIAQEPLGEDDLPDLVMANLKIADYVGHAYGPDSAEMKEALAALDKEITAILEALDAKVGKEGYLLAVTADHGMPPEPPEGRARHYNNDIAKIIHDKFDPEEKLVTHYGAENGQIYVDLNRARSLGVKLEQIRDLLLTQEFVVAAYTEDEVRRARVP